MADIHVHVTGPVTVIVSEDDRLDELDAKLDVLGELLSQLVRIAAVQAEEVSEVSFDLSVIQSAVENQTSVDASVLSLAQAMSQQIRDLSDQVAQEPAVQAALNQFADQLQAAAAPVAQFVTANTPAAGGTTTTTGTGTPDVGGTPDTGGIPPGTPANPPGTDTGVAAGPVDVGTGTTADTGDGSSVPDPSNPPDPPARGSRRV